MFKQKSIRFKLTLYIVLTTLVTTVIISASMIYLTYTNTRTQNLSISNNELEVVKLKLDKILISSSNRINDLADLVEETFDISKANENDYMTSYMQTLDTYLLSISSKIEGNLAIYVVFYADFITKTESELYLTALIRNNNSEYIPVETPPNISHLDPKNPDMAWYYRPLEERTGLWLKPYSDEFVQSDIFSYVVPIIIDDKCIALIGTDISREAFSSKDFLDLYKYKEIHIFDKELNILRHQDYETFINLNDVNENYFNVLNEAKDDLHNQIYEYSDVDGNHNFLIKKLLNGWYITINPSEKESLSNVYDLTRNVFIYIVLAISFSFIITLMISKNISTPLRNIKELFNTFSNKDLSIESSKIKLVNYTDEIGDLAKSFFDMHTDQFQLIKTAQKLASLIKENTVLVSNEIDALDLSSKKQLETISKSLNLLFSIREAFNEKLETLQSVLNKNSDENHNLNIKRKQIITSLSVKISDHITEEHYIKQCDNLSNLSVSPVSSIKQLINQNKTILSSYSRYVEEYTTLTDEHIKYSDFLTKSIMEIKESTSEIEAIVLILEELQNLIFKVSESAFETSVKNSDSNATLKIIYDKSNDLNKLVKKYNH